MSHLEKRKDDLISEINQIDESWAWKRLLKKRQRAQKMKTLNAIGSILIKRDKAETEFKQEKDLHLKDDPLYQKALKDDNHTLLDKFRSRKLTQDEYYNELYEETKTLPCWLFCVKERWKRGILNKDTWEFLLKPWWEEISEYYEWICCVYIWETSWRDESYLFDKKTLECLWKYSGWHMRNGLRFVILDWKYKFFNQKLWKVILEKEYDSVVCVDKNFAEVEKNKKWWLVDSEWNEIVAPKYDSINRYDDKDVAYTVIWDIHNYNKEWKKWWLIDKKTWKVIIEPVYDWIWDFEDWIAEVVEWKTKFFINKIWEIISK